MKKYQFGKTLGWWINGILIVLTILMYCKSGGAADASDTSIHRTVKIMLMHIVCMMVVRPMIAKIYSEIFVRKKNLLAIEREPGNVRWQGMYFATKLCILELIISIAVTFLRPRLFGVNEDVSAVENMAGALVPVVVLMLLLITLSKGNEEQVRITRLRRMSLENLRQKSNIWLLINETSIGIGSWFGGNIAEDDFHSLEAYILTKEDMRCLFPKKCSDLEIRGMIRRWCYIVQVETQEDLKEIFDKVYQEHQAAANDGLRKIVILNLKRTSTAQVLHVPDEYEKHEFFYYAELNGLKDYSFKLLAQVAGDDLNVLRVTTKKRQEKENDKKREKRIREEENRNNELRLRYFEHPTEFLKKINESVDYVNDISGSNTWLMNFYNSACVFQNPTRSVMALMDYWELMLRLESIYYYQMTAEPDIREEELVHANLMSFGRFLLKASKVSSEHHELLAEKTFQVPEVIQVYLHKLTDYIYIHFQGEKISFLGLVSMMQVIRNKIIAHGVLNEENASLVWGIAFWATGLLNSYMRLPDFQLNELEDTYEIGFEQTIRAGRLIVKHNNCPCIAAIEKSNGKSYIYVNFFNGELITPEYVEVGAE